MVTDVRGNLTFIEEDRNIPFPIKRVYYLYDVPGGAERGDTRTRACISSSSPYPAPSM